MENNQSKLRVIFMGTPAFAEHILSSLIQEKYNIISVYTQPDKKIGRKQNIQKSPVKITAEKNSITVFTPVKFDGDVIQEIKSQNPDILIVAAYGKILPKTILEIPRFGALNVHASLLPKYRGASPIQNAILKGEKETGITIMLMDEGVDTGDILAQSSIAIHKDETSFELSKKIAIASAKLLSDTIYRWIDKKINPKKQNDSEATFCQLIERQDGEIDWNDKAESIYNRYRAFYPWPGIFTLWKRNNSMLRLKLNKIYILTDNPEVKHSAGKVLQIGEKIGIQTRAGIIILEDIQLEGKASIQIKEFLNGYPDFLGTVLM